MYTNVPPPPKKKVIGSIFSAEAVTHSLHAAFIFHQLDYNEQCMEAAKLDTNLEDLRDQLGVIPSWVNDDVKGVHQFRIMLNTSSIGTTEMMGGF